MLCAVGMLALLRGSELTLLSVNDILEADGLCVRVSHSKTDQLHRGWVCNLTYVAGLMEVDDCWVRAIRDYWEQVRAEYPPKAPLFGAIQRTPGRERRMLSVLDVGGAVKRVAAHGGAQLLDGDFLAAHSLRRGGAVELSLHGVQSEDLMTLGRWKSASSLRTYLTDLMPRLAGVSVKSR